MNKYQILSADNYIISEDKDRLEVISDDKDLLVKREKLIHCEEIKKIIQK